MKRTNRFAKNVIFSAIAQIITMICGFIVPKIMLNYYGSEINGLVSSITQVMTYIALIEGGLSGASIFALYKPIADNNTKQISLVVSTSKSLYKKAGYIGLMVSIIVGVCYPLVIKTNLLSYQEIFFLFIIIACTTILDFFILGKYRALLSANQDEYILSISTMIQIIVNALCVSLFSYLGFNIVIVRLIALSSLLARVLVIYIACKKKYKDIKAINNISSTPVGYKYIIFVVIAVDGNMTTFESHKLADKLENSIAKLDNIYKAIVHVEPFIENNKKIENKDEN